jgi:hypothetical protein
MHTEEVTAHRDAAMLRCCTVAFQHANDTDRARALDPGPHQLGSELWLVVSVGPGRHARGQEVQRQALRLAGRQPRSSTVPPEEDPLTSPTREVGSHDTASAAS